MHLYRSETFKKFIAVSVLLLISAGFVVIMSCAGSGGGGAKYKDYRRSLGVATGPDFERISFNILDKHQYQIVRNERSADQVYVETAWRERRPFKDEVKLGVAAVRSRIILRGRPKDFGASGTIREFRIEFYGESQVRFSDASSYTRVPMSKMTKRYFKRIAGDLKTEISIEYKRF